MTTVIVRILLRYVAAALVAHGLLSPDLGGFISHDPDIETAVNVFAGAFLGVLSEGWYFLAHRYGWAK
jgi:hypothetical protein